MKLAFNELSSTNSSADKYEANEKMCLFAKTVAEVRKKGFIKIRSHYPENEINLSEGYTLFNWLNDKNFSHELRGLLYGFFEQPFIREDDDEILEQFIHSKFCFEDMENDITKRECLGLTSALLGETLAVSFQSSPAWQKNILPVIVEKGNAQETEIRRAFNVYSGECFEKRVIEDFVVNISPLDLATTNLLPRDKKIHLASHHGQLELYELWNKIKNSPYVIGGISTDWGGNSFCQNPAPDGKLKVVDLNSDRRYALLIQTTGRNLKETTEICKKLSRKYG